MLDFILNGKHRDVDPLSLFLPTCNFLFYLLKKLIGGGGGGLAMIVSAITHTIWHSKLWVLVAKLGEFQSVVLLTSCNPPKIDSIK